jgi:hypothetical protein
MLDTAKPLNSMRWVALRRFGDSHSHRRVLDFDRLAGQFLPRLLLVVSEQALDLGHVLLLCYGPLVPSVRALLLAGVLVDRSGERTPRCFDDRTDLRLLVVGQLAKAWSPCACKLI